eukprot:3911690-Rhodomonas_salina.1
MLLTLHCCAVGRRGWGAAACGKVLRLLVASERNGFSDAVLCCGAGLTALRNLTMADIKSPSSELPDPLTRARMLVPASGIGLGARPGRRPARLGRVRTKTRVFATRAGSAPRSAYAVPVWVRGRITEIQQALRWGYLTYIGSTPPSLYVCHVRVRIWRSAVAGADVRYPTVCISVAVAVSVAVSVSVAVAVAVAVA